MNTPTSLPLFRLLPRVAEAARAVTREGRSLNDVLAQVPPEQRPAVQALSFQVLRCWGAGQVLRRMLAARNPPPDVDALLTTALALLWPEAGAPYAVHTLVDEAVTATRAIAPGSAGFVNAVLRRFARETDALVAEARRLPEAEFNHPGWWIERVRADWPEHWQAVLRASNTHPPMTLRVNARRSTAQAYVERLAALGRQAQPLPPGDGSDQGVVLADPCPVTQLPGFAQGKVSVQDAAAQRAAPLLLDGGGDSLPAGARVLDACAAPGGKTAHLLERADLDLTALDADATRLQRVQDNLQRLGLQARLQLGDASRPQAWWDGRPFDAILLDAPCTASGIVRRHPDVRWLRRPADIRTLAATQAAMLNALWPLLAPGGRLLYATCSIFPAEGRQQIDAFLQRQPDARRPDPDPSPGHLLPLPDNRLHDANGRPQVLQDGFFLALLVKQAP